MKKYCSNISKKVFSITAAILISGVLQFFYVINYATPVQADDFYPTGGSVPSCSFASTLGVQYNSIGGNGISWSNGDVRGESGNWIQSNNMRSVADITFPDAHRYPNLGHYVAVPPNTRVEVGFFAWNYSGHSINVDALRLFTSYSDVSRGDITRLGAGGSYGNHCAKDFGCRGGKSVLTGSLGSYENRQDVGGRIAYTFDTIQPMQNVSFTASPQWSGGNLTVRYDLTLRNTSSYNLSNIRVRDTLPSGAVHDQTYSFSAGQTRTITYYDNMGSNYPGIINNDPARVYDPNRHYERASDAYSGNYDSSPETRPAFALRDDDANGSPAGWNANQPSWGSAGGGLFAVELIPYNFPTSETSLNVAPRISHEKLVRDADEDWGKENTITPSYFNEGENEFDYQITVTNNGGQTRDGVITTDDYDENLIEILDANGGNDNGDTITWDDFDLGNGESRTFNIRARVLMPLPHGIHEATNLISTEIVNEPDGSTTPEASSTRTTIRTLAENEIEKYVKNLTAVENGRDNSGNEVDSPEYGADADTWTDSEDDVIAVAGDVLEYTLTFRNTGNAVSPDNTVSDHLPRFLPDTEGNLVEIITLDDFIDVNPSFTLTQTDSGWNIVWQVGDIEPGEEYRTATFRVRINPTSENTLNIEDTQRLVDNTSEIRSSIESIELAEDNAVIRVDQPVAEITKGADKTIYQSDEQVIYQIEVVNNGSSTASGVIRETLHDGLVFESAIPEANRIDGQNLEWDMTLEARQTETIELTATFTRPVVDGSVHNNLVEFEYSDINENERPIVSDEFEVEVQAPILELEKVQDLPEVVAPGQPIIYSLNYSNTGSGYAPGTTITDTVPEHTTFVEVIDEGGLDNYTYDEETREVTWDLGQLEPEETGTVSFQVVIDIPTQSGTEIRNTGVIYSPVVEQIESEVVTAIADACCAGGTIWADENQNGAFDENEDAIEGLKVNISWQETEFLPENSVDVYTDVNGHYSHQGLPYYTPITFSIEKPEQFDDVTTQDSYTVALLPPREDGQKEDYVRDGIRYVTADGCMEFMNTGLYREFILADTGRDIRFELGIGIAMVAIGSAIGIGLLAYELKREKGVKK